MYIKIFGIINLACFREIIDTYSFQERHEKILEILASDKVVRGARIVNSPNYVHR